MSDVRPDWSGAPSSVDENAMSSGSASSSGVTIQGPMGPKPACDLPSENCAGRPASCITRSERSWPSVTPASADHASDSGMSRPPRPTTATTSISQSVWPPGGSVTVETGPVRQDANLVNTSGWSGAV